MPCSSQVTLTTSNATTPSRISRLKRRLRLSKGRKDIALPAPRLDDIPAQQASQASHVHFDQVGRRGVLFQGIKLVEQTSLRVHPVGVAHEVAQQAELGGGQRMPDTIDAADSLGGFIQGDAIHAQDIFYGVAASS